MEETVYQQKKNAFLKKLASKKLPIIEDNVDPAFKWNPEPTGITPAHPTYCTVTSVNGIPVVDSIVGSKPPSYAQVVMGQSSTDMLKNKYFNQISIMSLWMPEFKDTVFELLEAYNFQECTTFTELLHKWQKYDHSRGIPLSSFFNKTEPKINKLRFYEAAFDHLNLFNLVEFLSESIVNGDLDEEFIISLQNAV